MSTVFTNDTSELEPWIRDELELDRVVGRSDRGATVRRAQEWLTLAGYRLVCDGDFGPASEKVLRRYQQDQGLEPTGKVEEETWSLLTAPMRDVVRQRLDICPPFGEAVVEYAAAHLAVAPREVGGKNRGPWVRLYMRGQDGDHALWCAGFVTFVMTQAAESTGSSVPVRGSFSCDSLAAQADSAGILLAEDDATPDQITPGSIFLVRRTSSDWTHTGLVVRADDDAFETIEGNTNDAGDREGYEVCARTRDYARKDFVLL